MPSLPSRQMGGSANNERDVIELVRTLLTPPVRSTRVPVGGGGQAELATVHERYAMPVPEEFDWPAAGGFAEVFMTAYDALFTQAGLASGEHLLVHGGAGGVGTAAVQLGRAVGARVTATVRNPDLRESVAELGARVIAPEGFGEEGPFDVILELVGAPNLQPNVNALATSGRIVVI